MIGKMVIIVYFGVIFMYLNGMEVNSKHIDKCFGNEIGFMCGNKTRIAITELRYGTSRDIENGNTSCTITDFKCLQNITDFSEKYPYYYKNSGFESSSAATIIQWDNSVCPVNEGATTNFLRGTYKCIQESSIVNMCSSTKVSLQTEVYMLYPIPRASNANKSYCHCSIQSNEGIDIRAIDVRLHYNNGTCGTADNHLDIQDGTSNATFICEDEQMWDEFRLLFQSNESEVNISLHQEVSENDRPQMVFLQIQGGIGSTVDVLCNEEGLTTPQITTVETTTSEQDLKSSTHSDSNKLETSSFRHKPEHTTKHNTIKVKNHERKAITMSPELAKSKNRSEENLALYIVIGVAGLLSLLIIGIGATKWRTTHRKSRESRGNTNPIFYEVGVNKDQLMQDRINRFLVNDETGSKTSKDGHV